ncbi:hypothetical protein EB74_17855, partial [Mycobacterium sp. SWH-M5]
MENITGGRTLGLLSSLIDGAQRLFGFDDGAKERTYGGGGGSFADEGKPAPYPGTTPDAPPFPDDPNWGGSAAEKEKEAAKRLAEKTEELKALDAQLKALGDQIVDDNDQAKKKLNSLKDEIEKELEYAKTSPDDSIVKYEALNKFMQDKAGEVAKVVADAAATVAKRRGELSDIGNQYPGDVITAPGGDPSVPGGGYIDPSGLGAGYGETYDPGYYEDPYYSEDPGAFEDAAAGLADALPQMASALPGAFGGLGGANPLGDLGSVIGSAIQGAAQRRDEDLPRDENNDGEQSEKPGETPPPPAENENNTSTDNEADKDDSAEDDGEEKKDEDGPGAEPAGGAPAPPPAPTLVVRPDGSTATAASPA